MCVRGITFPVFVAGPDTKLMQNSGRTKFKRTSIDRLMNTLVLWVGHLSPLTFMAHTVTVPGLDFSSLNLVSYIASNNVFYPNLVTKDPTLRDLNMTLGTLIFCNAVFLSDLWLPGVYGGDLGCG